MRPLGSVQSPKPDGINGTFPTVIQPASGPTLKERGTMYREPTDEAKIRCNLGIAYTPGEPCALKGASTVRRGEGGGFMQLKARPLSHSGECWKVWMRRSPECAGDKNAEGAVWRWDEL